MKRGRENNSLLINESSWIALEEKVKNKVQFLQSSNI